MDSRCDPGIGFEYSGSGVTALAVDNTFLYIGGDASHYHSWVTTPFGSVCWEFQTGNVTRINKGTNLFVGLPFDPNGTTEQPAGSYLSGIGTTVSSMDLTNNRLVIGGNFTEIKDNISPGTHTYDANNLLILDVSGSTVSIDSRWDMNGEVTGVSARNNRIFLSGAFTSGKIWGGQRGHYQSGRFH